MADSYRRTALPWFELANKAYANAVITFYAVDPDTNERTDTLITLYSDITGDEQLENPYTLDGTGKNQHPIYVQDPTIALINESDVGNHSTGIFTPPVGRWRDDWEPATLYLPNDYVRDGASGNNTQTIYVVTIEHISAADIDTDIDSGALDVLIDVANAAAILVAVEADAAAVEADLVATEADVVTTNANASSTNIDRQATEADLLATEADATATAGDKTATEADLVATEADLAATEGDIIITAADKVATEADAATTEADIITTTADRVATEADAIATAADKTATEADLVSVEADLLSTEGDASATAADKTATEADLVATEADLASVEADILTIAESSLTLSIPGAGSNQTVFPDAKAAFPYRIDEILGARTTSGSINLAVQINGVSVTGLSAVAIDSTPNDTSASGLNTVAVGDIVSWVFSGNASAVDTRFNMSITRL